MNLYHLADLMGRSVETLRRLPPWELPPPVPRAQGPRLRVGRFVISMGGERVWDYETVCRWSMSPEFREAWAEWCRAQAKRRGRQ